MKRIDRPELKKDLRSRFLLNYLMKMWTRSVRNLLTPGLEIEAVSLCPSDRVGPSVLTDRLSTSKISIIYDFREQGSQHCVPNVNKQAVSTGPRI